jgi:hypothetical protein
VPPSSASRAPTIVFTRERAPARRLAQELLLVGQCEVHREDLPSELGVALVDQ